jgi:hypothetical protein
MRGIAEERKTASGVVVHFEKRHAKLAEFSWSLQIHARNLGKNKC